MHEGRISAKRQKLQARLKALVQQERDAAKRNAERRRKLAGRVVLDVAARDPAMKAELQRWLDAELTQDKDRALFDLPPKPRPDSPAPPSTEG